MKIIESPLPGWAWDLIEAVERGERKPDLVRLIDWRTRRNAKYDRWIRQAKAGDFNGTHPEIAVHAIESWENRKASRNLSSSGRAYRDWWRPSGTITVTAGTEVLDQRMVLLHEIAHLLTPMLSQHDLAWRRVAARLYSKYGGPEVVAWAIEHERKPLLINLLRRQHPDLAAPF
jgi:hypothetical protein